eukprot:902962-Rhodomonas_salina.3
MPRLASLRVARPQRDSGRGTQALHDYTECRKGGACDGLMDKKTWPALASGLGFPSFEPTISQVQILDIMINS